MHPRKARCASYVSASITKLVAIGQRLQSYECIKIATRSYSCYYTRVCPSIREGYIPNLEKITSAIHEILESKLLWWRGGLFIFYTNGKIALTSELITQSLKFGTIVGCPKAIISANFQIGVNLCKILKL